jgi:predicted Zn-dependent protease
MLAESTRKRTLARLLPALAALGGCATPFGRAAETDLAGALVSTEQENQIGLQVKSELEQKEHIQYLSDPTVVEYVRAVAGRVIAPGRRDRPDVNWQVNVIDDAKTVNAFATPGGYLYVYSGLIAAADNEAQLAGVMAHETGHVVARHSARSMVAAFGLESVAALAAGNNPGLARQLGTAIVANGLMLAHSRADETEADEYGARYAAAAGYDPHQLSAFFRTLQAKQGQVPGVMVYFSDHPLTADRIDHIEKYIPAHRLSGAQLNEAAYRGIKSRVAAYRPSGGGSAPPPPPGGAPPAPTTGAPPPPPR